MHDSHHATFDAYLCKEWGDNPDRTHITMDNRKVHKAVYDPNFYDFPSEPPPNWDPRYKWGQLRRHRPEGRPSNDSGSQ